ncbi:MAG: CoB--CoM heterodisulfide reductase iron-sulfur subunit B family protein [Pseudomonadota bacterium]
MTRVGYYPGCSLEATARDYAESIAAVAERLDIELVELPGWNCCGASAAHSLDHRAALNLGARNLALAAAGPQPVLVPCALCFNRLKSAQAELRAGGHGLLPAVAELGGDLLAVEVVELNSYLTGPELARRISEAVTNPLKGLKPVCYYGCQGQRPPAVTGHPRPENPRGLDDLLAGLGAAVIDWPFKTDCCGASHAVARPDLVHTLVGKLYERALARGANCIVTGCQMCQANLDLYQAEIAQELGRAVYLPVFYFTELIGLALDLPATGAWLGRHLTDPAPLLAQVGLGAGQRRSGA